MPGDGAFELLGGLGKGLRPTIMEKVVREEKKLAGCVRQTRTRTAVDAADAWPLCLESPRRTHSTRARKRMARRNVGGQKSG